jgi:hypothetical protein
MNSITSATDILEVIAVAWLLFKPILTVIATVKASSIRHLLPSFSVRFLFLCVAWTVGQGVATSLAV